MSVDAKSKDGSIYKSLISVFIKEEYQAYWLR